MLKDVVILASDQMSGHDKINWKKIGTVVDGIAQLYQVVAEHQVKLILVGVGRHDVNQGVAIRLRRPNGLTDLWKVTASGGDAESEPYYDGTMSADLATNGIAGKVRQILDEKQLLARYQIVGRAASMRALARTIDRIAPTDVSVLIVGPSGAGKELVARALHDDSPRQDRPYVTINCGALAEGLLESELFGHEKGAFTGSVGKREGLFKKAAGGTVFLDEIGETTPQMQVKLLRVLEDGTYYPVGSSVPQRSDVRVVAATNRDLAEAIAEKEFREDLYFRISAVKLVIPPLRERLGDIQPLLHHFWRDKKKALDYSSGALERLTQYDWPGNVRQLRNFAARMVALKQTDLVEKSDVDHFLSEQHATAVHLPVSTGRTVDQVGQELIYRAILSLGSEVKLLRNLITSHVPGGQPSRSVQPVTEADLDTGATMEEMEEALIRQVLQDTAGNRKETALRLGIGERTLYRKLAKYGLR